MFDDDEIENESPSLIRLPGSRPVRPRNVAIPEVDAMKLFFKTFFVVRDQTTTNALPLRRLLECFFSVVGVQLCLQHLRDSASAF